MSTFTTVPTTGSRFNLVRWLVLLLGFAVLYGVAGYMLFEGWSFTDSLYMTLSVLSTVGFREVQPLDASGQAFTATLMIAVTMMFSSPMGMRNFQAIACSWSSRRRG